jgi:hypothetical protein
MNSKLAGLIGAAMAVMPLSIAHATTHDLGPITASVPFGFTEFTGVGAFTDFLNFTTVGTGAGVGASIISFDVPTLPTPTYAATDLTLALFGGTFSNGSPPGGAALATSGTGNSVALAFASPLSGPFTLRVTGTGTGQVGGAYGGAISVSAVPLPAALPLMGAGLLGLGLLVARRRKENV